MASPPTANPRTRSRWDSSKASTIKSAFSRDGHTDYATKNISASRFSPACFRRYDPPKSPTRFPEDPEFLGHDRRHRIFLAVDRALLQGAVDFRERNRHRIGADGLGEHQRQRRRRHPELHALHVLRLHDRPVGGELTQAVVGERDDLVPGLVLVTPGQILEQLAVAIGLPVLEIAQHERRAADTERLVGRSRKIDAGVSQIDGAEAEPLVDLVLVADLREPKPLALGFAAWPLLAFSPP